MRDVDFIVQVYVNANEFCCYDLICGKSKTVVGIMNTKTGYWEG
jgi:hypothetical protein